MGRKLLTVALSIFLLLGGVLPTVGQGGEVEGRSLPAAAVSAGVRSEMEEYTIGPEDVLEILVYAGGTTIPSHKFEAIVRNDGRIFLELLGEVEVAGLTYRQVEEIIAQQMERYVRNPQVIVHIKEYHNQTVLVFGEAKMGVYPLSRPMRVAEFLASIGGPTANADVTKIVISRRDGTVRNFNLDRYVFKNDNTQNVLLQDGDKIFIPRKPRSLTSVLRENADMISAVGSVLVLLITLSSR